jgi:biotin transport system substrate-specific component
MLSISLRTRTSNTLLVRFLAIGSFAALTALTSRITVPLGFTPVPITLQVLAVLFAGLVLGAQDGALSQMLYVGSIAAGLPLDANGLGAAVLFSPTAGYLIGFIPGAFAAGYLMEKAGTRNRILRFSAAIMGIVLIYLCGTVWLTLVYLKGNWNQGWALGVVPFIGVDLAKAIIASSVAEGAREWFRRAPGWGGARE